MKDKISIIIPVYNEEGSVLNVINKIKETLQGRDYEIITVDDASTDNSYDILSKIEGIKVIKNPYNLGYGASLKIGIKAAEGEYILITDADGTYPIEDMPRLIKYTKDYDMVVGARSGKNVKIPLLRKPAKIILSMLANFLTGRKIPDLNSGFRIFKKEVAMEFFHLFPSRFSFTTTITLACLTNDYTVKYIPIDYHKRKGKSSIRSTDFANFFVLILRIITYFNPFKIFLLISIILLIIAALLFLYTKIILGRVMDITVLVTLIAALQVFLSGLIAELVVKTRERK